MSVLREADGSVRVTHETHALGLFSRDVWLRLMAEVGFTAERVTEDTAEDGTPRDVFIGRRT